MTTPRRRIVRPALALGAHDARRQEQAQKVRGRLEKERLVLARWLQRLKRSFHAFEQSQRRMVRLERQCARLED